MAEQVSYQASTLPENILSNLVKDDSPEIFNADSWPFMGADIQNADVRPWDFKNVLDMVDISILKKLEEYPLKHWDVARIQKLKAVLDKEHQRIIQIVESEYHITRYWAQLYAKTYNKMMRARNGFQINALTTTRGILQQSQELRGYNPAALAMGGQPVQAQQKTGGWKL